MRATRRGKVVAALLVLALSYGAGSAYAGLLGSLSPGLSRRWTTYLDRRTGNVIVVKTRCILAEDSAGHLRLRDYRDHGGTIIYGCARRGY